MTSIELITCVILFSSLSYGVLSLDICQRFPQMSACAMINKLNHPDDPPPRPVPVKDKYCVIGCQQKGHEVLDNGCHCDKLLANNDTFTTWITTVLPTTEGKLVTTIDTATTKPTSRAQTTEITTTQSTTAEQTTTESTTTEPTTKEPTTSETTTKEPTTTESTTTESTTTKPTTTESTTTEPTTTEPTTTEPKTTEPTSTEPTTTEPTTTESTTTEPTTTESTTTERTTTEPTTTEPTTTEPTTTESTTTESTTTESTTTESTTSEPTTTEPKTTESTTTKPTTTESTTESTTTESTTTESTTTERTTTEPTTTVSTVTEPKTTEPKTTEPTTSESTTTESTTMEPTTTESTTSESTTTESTTTESKTTESTTTEPTTTESTTTESSTTEPRTAESTTVNTTTEQTTAEPKMSTSTVTNPISTASTQSTKSQFSTTESKITELSTITATTASTTITATTTTTPTTTTEAPTTTSKPQDVCVYSLHRPPQLKTVSKRLYEGTPVAINCQYPGLVGVFRQNYPTCMGILLDEDTILIDYFCAQYVENFPMKVLVESYNTADIAKSTLKLDSSSLKLLDPRPPVRDSLQTVKLSSPVTFDDTCVQPACVPNPQIQADDIDFDDCRFVGYGDTAAIPGPDATRLMEVDVTVDRSSVKLDTLKVTRKVGPVKTGPCFNDYGSPVICSDRLTKEWITVGMTTGVAMPCDSGNEWSFTVQNLLGEAVDASFYRRLQQFKYASRP